jgi:DNA-binding GntR family transcriptional regulator
VEHRPHRGYFIATEPAAIAPSDIPEPDEDQLYYRIAEDRLAKRIGDRMVESEIARRYRTSRVRVRTVFARMAQEGWLRRLPGHGWAFQPMLDSVQGYEESYRFRAIIEPAALRTPGYVIAPEAIARLRSEQRRLLEDPASIGDSEIFRIGADFHEVLVAGSGNMLLVDAMRRVNSLRRLLEYRAKRDRAQLRRQCEEHLKLLDLLERKDLAAAATFLEKHLDSARKRKSSLVA